MAIKAHIFCLHALHTLSELTQTIQTSQHPFVPCCENVFKYQRVNHDFKFMNNQQF